MSGMTTDPNKKPEDFWLSKFLRDQTSLAPASQQPEQSLGETAGDMAVGSLPVVGTAQALRDMYRNYQDRDWTGMGMSAASLIPGGKLLAGIGGAKTALIAGLRAKNAPVAALKHAEEMKIARATPQQQWDETGAKFGTKDRSYVGPDGMPKFEINDTPARLHKDFDPTVIRDYNDPLPLAKILHHPELFERYPHLRDALVYGGVDAKHTGNAAYMKKLGVDDFEMIENTARNPGEYMTNLLHEVQHGIQAHEGFSGGANYGDHVKQHLKRYRDQNGGISPGPSEMPMINRAAMKSYKHNMGEAESRAVERRWVNGKLEEVPSNYPDVDYDQLTR